MEISETVYVMPLKKLGKIRSIQTIRGFKGYPVRIFTIVVDDEVKTYNESDICDVDRSPFKGTIP